jgi:hypothetical protein
MEETASLKIDTEIIRKTRIYREIVLINCKPMCMCAVVHSYTDICMYIFCLFVYVSKMKKVSLLVKSECFHRPTSQQLHNCTIMHVLLPPTIAGRVRLAPEDPYGLYPCTH